MDHLLYIAASGARETMLAQAANSHNLANASTVGFKADLVQAMSAYVSGQGVDSRAYSINRDFGSDLSAGPMRITGRDLDVAITGEGWIAVQATDGSEGLTHRGDLRVDEFGQLVNGAGQQLLGNRGPIALPPYAELSIGTDGTISIIPLGEAPNTLAVIDRIKLVNPGDDNLQKGPDGLMRPVDGGETVADADVQLVSGTLESSNVNTVDAMVRMIELARQFEHHVKMMSVAEEMDDSSAALMRLQ